MAVWDALIHFRAGEDDRTYFAPIPLKQVGLEGLQVHGYTNIRDIENGAQYIKVTVKKVKIWTRPSLALTFLICTKLLAPVPALQPVICIGLNYTKHVEESGGSKVKPFGSRARLC